MLFGEVQEPEHHRQVTWILSRFLEASSKTLSSLSAVSTCAGGRCVSGLTGTADKRAMNSTAAYGDSIRWRESVTARWTGVGAERA
jgi:hypothetical protein